MVMQVFTVRTIKAISAVSLVVAVTSCGNPGRRAELVQQADTLRRENQRLERLLVDRDGAIALLNQQIVYLQTFEADRPANLFAPVKLEIASLSGGADYDDRPGDDGVTVYLRPRDSDGHIVKAPGAISVQLLDNTDLNNPRVIGVFDFTDPETIRKSWYGKFGTSHYTLKCPFPDGSTLPQARKIMIHAEFVDFLTGAVLTAAQEVTISRPGD